jgi:putative transposase
MSLSLRKLSNEYPIHISVRRNNKEIFPVPLADAWDLFSNYLHFIHHGYRIKIHSFVLMSNHFHLIVSDPELNLSKAMAIFMRETSRELNRMSNRINRIWGSPFHSCIIEDTHYYLNAYKYNYRNPVAAKICDYVEDYPWSTLQILLGIKRGIIPLEEDQTLLSDPSGTLNWLNEAYLKDEAEAIRLATRKKVFNVARDPKTKRKIQIEMPHPQ